MPTHRLLALIDAEHGLEGGASAPDGPARGRKGERVQGLDPEAMLIGEMEDAPALKGGEALDLEEKRRPAGRAQTEQRLRGPAQHLGELEDQEGPLLVAVLGRGAAHQPELVAQLGERQVEAERIPRYGPQGQPLEQQPHREELDQRAGRDRTMNPVGALLDMPKHPGPALEGQQRSRHEGLRLLFLDAEGGQRVAEGFLGRKPAPFDVAQDRPEVRGPPCG